MRKTLNTKTVVKGGTLAAALTAIGAFGLGAWAFAKPYAMSESPPLAGVAHVQQEDVKITGLIQTVQYTQQYLKTMQQQMLFLAQQNWTETQTQAEAQLRQNPNNLAARQQLNTANQALIGIQRQLYGTP